MLKRFFKVLSRLWIGAVFIPLVACGADTPKVEELYQTNCASCHGANGQGGSGANLLDDEWKYGGSDDEIAASIAHGYPPMGMPGWEATMSPTQIRSLVIYLREKRASASSDSNATRVKMDQPIVTQKATFRLQIVAKDFHNPWGFAFLPDGRMLVTEKAGVLRIVDKDGKLEPEPIRGTPPVMELGQGGMMAVAVHPDYAKNGWIYLGIADGEKNEKGEMKAITAIVRGRIKDGAWVAQEWIYRADKKFLSGAGVHFGTRIVFDSGYIYFVVGERGGGLEAQDVKRPNGKIFRLFDDGRVPPDNPFVSTEGAEPGIWSYGHRNPQGLAMDLRDHQIYETEHGPRGGDEFNHIEKGKNYGWPVITYGMNYNGTPMPNSIGTAKDGMEQPVTFWVPSIAACGLTFYNGDLFPKWENDFFAGSLKAEELHRLHVENGKVTEQEIVLKGAGRIRSVETGPDGAIYLLLNAPDILVKMVPEG